MGKRKKAKKCEDIKIKKKKSFTKIEEINLNDTSSSRITTIVNRKMKKNKNENLEKTVTNENFTEPKKSTSTLFLWQSEKSKNIETEQSQHELNSLLSAENERTKLPVGTGKKHCSKSKTKKFKKEPSESISPASSKPKKIIFVDDKPCEVLISSEKMNEEKQKKFLNDDEAEVKEEDIDKFCDELDEGDNKQYEDWIKLIEAKLHENKKSK